MESTLTTKFAHLQIPLEDVLKATNNFADENIIGHGGFGPAYKGRLLRSEKLVRIAAKRLDRKTGEGNVEFWTEVSLLSDLKHENLVSIIGFCDEKGEKVIITPSMANGSLQGDLDSPSLTWTQRLRISVGVARALSYLHYDEGRGYGVIHRNVNSTTILLDENLEAKLSGFGISIKQSVNRMNKVLLTEPIGTVGYMDPSVEKTRGVTHKSDTYSFGVVLFEMLCGRRAYIQNGADKFLAPLVKYHHENKTLEDIIHPNLRNQMSPGSLLKYSTIAYSCLHEDAAHRPDANYIIKKLEKALKRQLRYGNFVNNFGHLKVSLDDIKSATHNFSNTYRFDFDHICSGYRVELDHFDKEIHSTAEGKNTCEHPKRHNTVVIKRYPSRHHFFTEESFFNEIEKLVGVQHPSIVTLLGFCVEGFEMVLITENVSYLGFYLQRGNKTHILTWEIRLRICIDVANALNYLHTEKKDQKTIIHHDITSFGIGLDENLGAKIVDFWFSVFLAPNQEDKAHKLRMLRKLPYVDPEYVKNSNLKIESKRESDVYSFGVVLLEILCGRLAYDPIYIKDAQEGLVPLARRSFSMGTLEDMIDPIIKEETNKDSLHTFIEIAFQCVAETQDQRPTMEIVLHELEKAVLFQVLDQEERVDKDEVVDELEKANHEIPEEGVQHPHTNELNKALELQLRHEIIGNKFEHLKVPLANIKSATHNFSDTYLFDSYEACSWYRVELDHFDKENHLSVKGKNKDEHPKRHNTVVIKRYGSGHHIYNEECFFTEIEMLVGVKHPNIATLLGFCVEGSEMILVIENVSNGFLGSYLGRVTENRIFTWENRLKICIDVAHALNYLHSEMEDQKMIINRFINSDNIGLDENWGAKIVEFVLSVYLPPNQEDEALYLDEAGTQFHIDPEYKKTLKLKRESDVYSFGVVLFEILCGRLACDPIYKKESDKGLADVARRSFCMGKLEDMIDPLISGETGENNFVLNRGPTKESLHTFLEIAYWCVTKTQDERPTMKVVVDELEKALLFQKNNKENPKISLEDINQATQNFHNNNCIGGGGFGGVYKGNLQDGDGFKTIVAKRLDRKYGQGEKQFLSELQILMEYKHENVVGLVGYCDEKDEKIIVYEYEPRGSLDKYLNDASLTWVKRLKICIDVASALDFLHGGVGKQAKVIHRDIKTANILLNQNWKAKLGDFGLSLISPLIQETDYVIDHACGTPGYLDPLYGKSGFLTIESDIYSFGVVLFEILCGRSTFAIKKQEGCYLPYFIKNKFEEGKHDEVVFEQIREQIMPKSLTTFQEIAYRCLHHERGKRPTTKKNLLQLKKALEYQNMASTITELAHLRIPLEDVVKATNNFHHDNIIGHHDFGRQYKGQLLRSEKLMMIAAQRFEGKHEEGDLAFLTGISVLSDLKHTNLVSIIGFCYEKDEKIIVTTYEANASLESYLNSPDLIWTQRLRICVDIARALSYLHSDEGRDYSIIHCNITRTTILLDDNWEAKLSGFEISIKQLVCYKDQVCLCEHIGKMGCLDPAIEETGGVTHKSDIYSFGVVLFEILCGRKGFFEEEANRFLGVLAKYHFENQTLSDIIHPNIRGQVSRESLFIYINLAFCCLDEDRAHRPDMNHIVSVLEKALELQLQYENIGNKFEYLKVPLANIKSATHNFSDTYLFDSDEACSWYRVELDHFDKENHSSVKGKNKDEHPKRHNTVVIKRYGSGHHIYNEERFFTEIEMLVGVKHPNIATLLGFCVEGSEMILVIENVSNGFLGSYLGTVKENRIFTWENRLKICIDVAHALNYLHSEMEDQKMIINRFINSDNIGLDENWGAKIVEFVLSVYLPPNQEDEALYLDEAGTQFHIDPEYKKTLKLKRESDVYSFGVVLFEILCGRLACDPIYKKESDKGLADVARRSFCMGKLEDMIDPLISGETGENNFVLNRGPTKESLHTFLEIAYWCVTKTQDERPTMKVVVDELEKALLFQKNNKENPKISLEDINQATQNFHNNNCIGGGGFGGVYKGNLQDGDGFKIIVAKRLDRKYGQGEKQFLSELQILMK